MVAGFNLNYLFFSSYYFLVIENELIQQTVQHILKMDK